LNHSINNLDSYKIRHQIPDPRTCIPQIRNLFPPMSSALPPASAAADISADAQTKIDHIVAMGFNRAEVETCMRAASNDTDTAIEFLLGGIPASGLRTDVEVAAPASSTSPSTEHICTSDLAG
jgi:hypothetical protein